MPTNTRIAARPKRREVKRWIEPASRCRSAPVASYGRAGRVRGRARRWGGTGLARGRAAILLSDRSLLILPLPPYPSRAWWRGERRQRDARPRGDRSSGEEPATRWHGRAPRRALVASAHGAPTRRSLFPAPGTCRHSRPGAGVSPSSVTIASPGCSAPASTQPRSAVSHGWLAVVWIVSVGAMCAAVVVADPDSGVESGAALPSVMASAIATAAVTARRVRLNPDGAVVGRETSLVAAGRFPLGLVGVFVACTPTEPTKPTSTKSWSWLIQTCWMGSVSVWPVVGL